MAVGLSYEQAKKKAWGGFTILLIVTLGEVGIALLGNGHLIEGFSLSKVIMYPVMIILSAYKAYYIVKEFMHMGYELNGLILSVILPMLLLVWAIIAFLMEGDYWNYRRQDVKQKNEIEVDGAKIGQSLKMKESEEVMTFF